MCSQLPSSDGFYRPLSLRQISGCNLGAGLGQFYKENSLTECRHPKKYSLLLLTAAAQHPQPRDNEDHVALPPKTMVSFGNMESLWGLSQEKCQMHAVQLPISGTSHTREPHPRAPGIEF